MGGFIKTIIRRVIISAIREGAIQRFDADGLVPNEFKDRELFQQYGFSSGKAGMEGVVLGMGNVFYLIASDDRRYRVAREDGETVIYTDEGDKIHLKRGREIDIISGGKVVVTAPVVELGGGALQALIDARIKAIYDIHIHPYLNVAAPSQTGVPTVPLDLASCSTIKTTAS